MFTVAPTTGFNSFASVSDSTVYHNDRGNAAWSDHDAATKQTFLIKATDYIMANYVFASQPWSDEAVEPMVIAATSQLALYAITHNLTPVGDEKVMTSETKRLDGVGTIEAEYAAGLTADRFPAITNMLANLATFSPASSKSRVAVGRILR